jgi:hypothetical protein
MDAKQKSEKLTAESKLFQLIGQYTETYSFSEAVQILVDLAGAKSDLWHYRKDEARQRFFDETKDDLKEVQHVIENMEKELKGDD